MERYKEQKWSGEKGKKFGHAGRVNDPYELAAGQEAGVCQDCHAVYQGKRWFFDGNLYDKLAGAGKVRQVVCPTCRKIKDHYVEGYLTLSGDFWVQHREEIIKLLEKEAGKVGKRNCADRIVQMIPEAHRKLVVETTTEKLAQHLGRTISKAYKRRPELPLERTQPVRAGLLDPVREEGFLFSVFCIEEEKAGLSDSLPAVEAGWHRAVERRLLIAATSLPGRF